MILFAGDPHGSYEHLYPFVQENDNVALIIWATCSFLRLMN